VRFSGLRRHQGTRPGRNYASYIETVGFGCQSSFDVRFLSLSAGVFPAIWKESFVVPLFKNGNKCDMSCYRGISILSAILKLFEKIVCDRITPVVRPVISDAQHGFVKGHSTVSNLVQFTNGVIGEIEDGWQVDGVYTDFSKAFDSLTVQFINFIWWVAFVLDGVLSDRSNTVSN
jgi:hypothetical protein